MIFKKIVLNNFRQYEGEVTIKFGTENGKITLIVARNGVGKTTLLQAFRFCFYGESPNVLKLPTPEELLNYNVFEMMEEGSSTLLSVNVEFEHQGNSYLAIREVSIMKFNNKMKSKNQSSFYLKEYEVGKGYRELPDAKQRINEMMPLGLAHVYMFDGERVEKPIESPEFRKDFKESIVGILGLKKLSTAVDFLGDRNKPSSVLGKIKNKLVTQTDEEEQLLKKETEKYKIINDRKQEIKDKNKMISTLDFDIIKAEEEQKKVHELRLIILERDKIESQIDTLNQKIASVTSEGCRVACQLVYLIQLAKTYSLFQKVEDSKENSKELFNGLYDTVIRDVLDKRKCICGRCIEPGSKEVEYLQGLSALPNDNVQYLNQINQMYSQIYEAPALLSKLKNNKMRIIELKKERYPLEKSSP